MSDGAERVLLVLEAVCFYAFLLLLVAAAVNAIGIALGCWAG